MNRNQEHDYGDEYPNASCEKLNNSTDWLAVLFLTATVALVVVVALAVLL